MGTLQYTASRASRRQVALRRIIFAGLGCLLFGSQLSAADYSYVRLSVPGSTETWATSINARGDIVGLYFVGDARNGYVFRKGAYTTLPLPEGAVRLGARAINARGDIVGNFDAADGTQHAFLLSGGHYTVIANDTSAFGLNNAGEVVGPGYLLRDGKFLRVPNGAVRGVQYNVFDVQDNGRVVVGVAIGSSRVAGFISRKAGEIELIEHPDASLGCTGIRGINERGDVVGFFVTDGCDLVSEHSHGFLLRDGEFTVIDFPGGLSSDAWGINDDGVIVGRYIDRNGAIRGFRAKPGN